MSFSLVQGQDKGVVVGSQIGPNSRPFGNPSLYTHSPAALLLVKLMACMTGGRKQYG